MSEYGRRKVREMMDTLTALGVFEKNGETYHLSTDFDFTFRGHLGRILKKNLDPTRVENNISEAYVETLKNYGFFNQDRTEVESVLAINILRTYEKDGIVEKLVKAVGM